MENSWKLGQNWDSTITRASPLQPGSSSKPAASISGKVSNEKQQPWHDINLKNTEWLIFRGSLFHGHNPYKHGSGSTVFHPLFQGAKLITALCSRAVLLQLEKFTLQESRIAMTNHHLGVSKNRDTPKWMVYNGKPFLKWMIWGYPYFRKHPCFLGDNRRYCWWLKSCTTWDVRNLMNNVIK